jgi:hypothetical protein
MDDEQIIANFLKRPEQGGAYTDERLAMLLAHAEDGKLAYVSCCCLTGITTADHPPRGKMSMMGVMLNQHWRDSKDADGWLEVDDAYHAFGMDADGRLMDNDDELRRMRLIPLIKAEISRRESLRTQSETSELVTV